MIRTLLLRLLANAAALYFVVQFLQPNFLITGGTNGFLITAAIFGILNGFAKPLLRLLTFPLIFLTAGLFTFAINMFLVWFAQYALNVLQFEGISILIEGGWPTYLYVGFLMSVANILIHWLTQR